MSRLFIVNRLNVCKGKEGCGNVLWGNICLTICVYFNHSSHFHCSLQIFNLLKTTGKNRSNVQSKSNSPA